MCTAIAKNGNDLIYGFNFDVDPEKWPYKVVKTKNYFGIGITLGSTTYLVHGINKEGHFGNSLYMNGEDFVAQKGKKRMRIDLLNDRFVRGKYSFDDVEKIIDECEIINNKNTNLHSLIGNENGEYLLVEPGYGIKRIKENFAVLTNFPVLTKLNDYSNPFFGKDRYDHALKVLKKSKDNYSVKDAYKLLEETKQDGKWGTRVSFVYSKNENKVYYCLDGNFSDINVHQFI